MMLPASQPGSRRTRMVIRVFSRFLRLPLASFRLRTAAIAPSEELFEPGDGIRGARRPRELARGTGERARPPGVVRQTPQEMAKQRRIGLADERSQMFARLLGGLLALGQPQPDQCRVHPIVDRQDVASQTMLQDV